MLLISVVFLLAIIALSPSILSDSVFAQTTVATPANPIDVSSITDGVGGFDELLGASGLTTVTIGSSTYALVASVADDGVQIIDITNPAAPTAVSSVTDDSTFDTLDGAFGITTVTIGSATYALVASQTDDGVQIINITNPAAPTAVASITDGASDGGTGTFDELDGAFSITTVKIGSATYALVGSFDDDGVQIINITNPAAPTAVYSISDGDSDGNNNTFDELDGARSITTVTIGSATYALVVASNDDGVQIIDITNPAAPTAVSSVTDDSTFDELDGAFGITTVTIDSSTYALVASATDNGVQIIDITNPAAPTAVSSVTDDSTFDELVGAFGITTVTISSSTYALVASSTDDGIQIIDISTPAAPTAVSSVTDGSTFDELDGARAITTVTINSSIYALVAAATDNGVQIIRISEPPASLTNPLAVSSVTDNTGGFTTLSSAGDITTVQIGEFTYAIVATLQDASGGIQIIDITNPGNPSPVSAITVENTPSGVRLNGATDTATVKIGQSTYALVAAVFDDTVQVIDITNPADPTAVLAIVDGRDDGVGGTFDTLGGANSISVITMGQTPYALVASNDDHGVQIMDITNPAVPIAVASVRDEVDGFDELRGANDITTVQIGSSVYALVTSFRDNGVQIIDITDIENPVAASSINGGAGGFADLSDINGISTVKIGGSTYALVTAGVNDIVQIIDISNPTRPTAVTSLTDVTSDSASPFDNLDYPTDVTTVTIDGLTYAIVAGNISDGVQFINISDPTMPTAVSSVTQGDIDNNGTTFNRLNGPVSLTTVQIDSSLYVLVANNQGNVGVQLIRIAEDQPEPAPEPVIPDVMFADSIIAVSSITDGSMDSAGNTFDTIDNPYAVATVQIGSSVYALSTSFHDDGIQIIDITDPTNPLVTSSVNRSTSGIGGGLDKASNITTVRIGSSVYALVTAGEDDRFDSQPEGHVQIIDITNPANPSAVSLITHGAMDSDGVTFDELRTPQAIETFSVGQSTYAIVASSAANGVQIIDITDPSDPLVASSITDGQGGFSELRAARDVSIIKMDQNVYALVASNGDDGVQIINVSDPTNPRAVSAVTDDAGGFDTLDGAISITTVVMNQSVYALVTSNRDNGVQIIDITNINNPTAVTSVTDGSTDGNGNTFDELFGARGITTVFVDGSTYAIVTSSIDDGIQIIDITDPTDPTVVTSLTDYVDDGTLDHVENADTFDTLDGSDGVATVRIGSAIYALVAATSDDGIQIIRIAENQPEPEIIEPEPVMPDEVFVDSITTASSITDGDMDSAGGTFGTLDSSRNVATVEIGSSVYALVTSFSDDGIQIINMTDPEDPIAVSSVNRSTSGIGGALDMAFDIAITRIGPSVYALVIAGEDDRFDSLPEGNVQIINITDPTNPRAVSLITHDGTDSNGVTFDELRSPRGIDTFSVGPSTYAIVAGSQGNGVQIINISNPSDPLVASSITDGQGGFSALRGAADVSVIKIGQILYAIVASGGEDAVQIINITNPTNPIAVSSVSDGVGGFDALDGASRITTVVIDQSVYALVTTNIENGVQIIDITDPATPTAVSSVTDGGVDGNGNTFDELRGARGITTVTIYSSTYAIVAGNTDDGIQIIDITDPAAPTAVASLADYVDDGSFDDIPNADTFDTLARPFGVTTIKIDSAVYALVASTRDEGIQIIRITEPGIAGGSSGSSSDGSSSDWKKKPTFGKSWEVSSDQLVKNGFSFNGYSLDITDNWHTDFVKTTTIIGEINHVTMKVFAFDGLKYVQLSLGLPEIGATSDAEADIIINLERNYSNPNDYDIVGIEHEQTEALVNTDSTTASITPSLCNPSHTEPRCYTIDIEFAVDAPLSDDVIAISAIDTKRRAATTYINDGVEFVGESLLPAETASIFIKKTNQDKGNHIILTQDDRRYNTWTDQDGYQWIQNSYGTWIQQTLPGMTISHDGSTQVMTRLHSEFGSIVQQEQERAISVFDSKSLQSIPGESFSYDLPKTVPRHLDESLLERMELEEILALEKMLNIYIYDDDWSEIDDVDGDGDDSNE